MSIDYNLFYWVESGQLRTDDVVQHDLCRLISSRWAGCMALPSSIFCLLSRVDHCAHLSIRGSRLIRGSSHRPNSTLTESIGIRLVTNTAGTFVVPALSSLGRLELRYLPPPPPPPPPAPPPLLGVGETKRPCKGFHRPGSKPAARLALSTMELTDGAAAAVVGIVLQ
eukprot:COSAG06_NODE_12374_length_1389_cov_11.841860_2_plen_168_part_00